ncbi:MAG: hypothetical protein MZV64_21680 [Ignavibacteriales bacterium]|nr:hypothetical protein [Ignavibacteriales bacterium]
MWEGFVYVIDLTKSDFQNAEVFNLQLKTATPYYGGTGATIPIFRWSVSNHLPLWGIGSGCRDEGFHGISDD